MIKIIKIFVFVMILSYLIGIVNSREYTDENFLDPNVYKNIDFDREDIYIIQAFYDNLPDDKWSSLRYDLISNFDLIRDHSKIDGQKFLKDLGCVNCFFNVYEEQPELSLLTYSGQGIKHIKGDYVSIPGTYHNSEVYYSITEDGIIVGIDPGSLSDDLEVPLTDSVTVTSSKHFVSVKIGDDEFDLAGGDVRIKNGEIILEKGREDDIFYSGTIINGVRIKPNGRDTRLFFDGKERDFNGNELKDCDCNYVSMNEDSRILISGINENNGFVGHSISFEDTQFVKTITSFSMVHNFGTIILENRENEQPEPLIPKLMMIFSPSLEEEAVNIIKNGLAELTVRRDGRIDQVVYATEGISRKAIGSTPIVIHLENLQGVSYLGTINEPKGLIIDDKSRISTLNYDEIITLEPETLYFSVPEYVRSYIEKAREAIRNRNELTEEIKREVGVSPMFVLGWLDEEREYYIANTLESFSSSSGISAEFLTAMAFQEGLNIFIEESYYKDPNADLDGSYILGLDFFASNVELLKDRGFLRKDFDEYRESIGLNEKLNYEYDDDQLNKYASPSATFDNYYYGLEAFTAEVNYRRQIFLSDAAKLGYDGITKPVPTENQIDYWTYVYWNCGIDCEVENPADGIEIPKEPGEIDWIDPIGNAQRVLATTKLIRKTGLFDRTISEKIAEN